MAKTKFFSPKKILKIYDKETSKMNSAKYSMKSKRKKNKKIKNLEKNKIKLKPQKIKNKITKNKKRKKNKRYAFPSPLNLGNFSKITKRGKSNNNNKLRKLKNRTKKQEFKTKRRIEVTHEKNKKTNFRKKKIKKSETIILIDAGL